MEEGLSVFVAKKGSHGGIWNAIQAGKTINGESIGELFLVFSTSDCFKQLFDYNMVCSECLCSPFC